MYRAILILTVLLTNIVNAQYDRPGSTSAQFLNIGVNARAAALGNAYIAIVNGPEATYYNPALLTSLEGTKISFTHTNLYAGINHDFVAISRNFGQKIGTFGLSTTGLYTDEMEVRTPLQPDGTGETFRSLNLRIGLSYARVLTRHVSLGGTVSYVYLSLYDEFNADAVAFDIAAVYKADFRGFSFGMMISNFGSDIKFINEAYPLPTNFTFGMGMNILELENVKILSSLAVVKPNDGKPMGKIGSEITFQSFLSIRLGYRPNHDVSQYSFGAGINFIVIDRLVYFDYSYSDYRDMGNVHRITFGLDI